MIRNSRGISRAEIAKETGISPPTVGRIVDELIQKDKLVIQAGMGTSSGGRPPQMVHFNGQNNYIIGIDWSRTHIYATLANLNADNICEIDTPITSHHDFKKDLQRIFQVVENLLVRSGIRRDKLIGIGIGAAGYVNKKGIIEYSPNFSWKNANLHQPLFDKFKVPVIVSNDSRVMALGEFYYGSYGLRDFAFVNIAYGIGAGIIMKGKLITGFNGISGEIGHTRIDAGNHKSRKCGCGKHNCLESFASGKGIRQTALERIEEHPDSLINELSNGYKENVTAELVARAAREGDSYARGIMLEVSDMLGISLANLANILNVQAIVLGGKVANAGDFFIQRIRKVFDREQLPHTTSPVSLMKTSIPENTAGKGAVALILKEVLNLTIIENKYLKSPPEYKDDSFVEQNSNMFH